MENNFEPFRKYIVKNKSFEDGIFVDEDIKIEIEDLKENEEENTEGRN